MSEQQQSLNITRDRLEAIDTVRAFLQAKLPVFKDISTVALMDLKFLNLNNFDLESIPSEIGSLTNLEVLDLSNNKLVELPETLGQLTNLEKLYVDCNRLAHIPQTLGNLAKLETLSLNNNKLASLPSSLGNLGKLKDVRLTRNKLTTLPVELANLSNLEFLTLRYNQLCELPHALGDLSKLKKCFIGDNEGLAALPLRWIQRYQDKTLWIDLVSTSPLLVITSKPAEPSSSSSVESAASSKTPAVDAVTAPTSFTPTRPRWHWSIVGDGEWFTWCDSHGMAQSLRIAVIESMRMVKVTIPNTSLPGVCLRLADTTNLFAEIFYHENDVKAIHALHKAILTKTPSLTEAQALL